MGMINTWWTKIIDMALPPTTDIFPKQLVEYQGSSSETAIIFPYGMYANVSNDVLALMFFVGGNSENRVAIPGSFQVRPTLEQGEVAIYRPDGDALIKFTNAGDIEISTSANVTVNCVNADINATGNVTVDCVDVTVTNSGIATINSTGNVSVTAPTVAITGNLTVSGTIVANGEVTGSGVALSSHTHSPGSFAAGGDAVTGSSGGPS